LRWRNLFSANTRAAELEALHFAVAAGDAVYVVGGSGTSAPEALVAKLDATTGVTVWSTTISEGHPAGGGPVPSIAIGKDASSLYVSAASNGTVSKLNSANGDVVWTWRPDGTASASSSQPIDLFEYDGRTMLAAWDAGTPYAFHMLEDAGGEAKSLWTWRSNARCNDDCGVGSNGVSFTAATPSGRPVVLVSTHLTSLDVDEQVSAHDALNGTLLWSIKLGYGYDSEGAPLLDETTGTAFVGLTYGFGSASRIGPAPLARLLAINIATGSVVANVSTPASDANTVLAMPSAGGVLLVAGIASTDPTSSAVNATISAFRVASTGLPTLQWVYPVADASVYAVWPTLDSSGKLFVLLSSDPTSCRLVAVQLSPSGQPQPMFDVSLTQLLRPTGSGGYGVVEEAAITADGGLWVPCGNAHGVIGNA
jgi:hypothetical protein